MSCVSKWDVILDLFAALAEYVNLPASTVLRVCTQPTALKIVTVSGFDVDTCTK